MTRRSNGTMTVVCEGPPAIAQKSLARPRVDPFIIFVVRTCTTSLVSRSRHWHVQEGYEKRMPQQFKLHYSGSTAWKRKRAYLGAQVFEPRSEERRVGQECRSRW